MTHALILRDLTAGYDTTPVLHGVSLTVPAGEITALIGGNGAGKSTTLMRISGLVTPTSGSIFLGQQDLTDRPAHAIVVAGVVQSPEGRRVFGRMSVHENLMMGAYLRRHGAETLADEDKVYALFPRLKERRHQLAGTLSGGEQQMLALGRAMMARPRILLLDEPSLGLAPLIVADIFRAIRLLCAEGVGILLVEQNARLALSLAKRAYVMEHGRLVLEGNAAELAADPRIQATYLGGDS